MLNATNTPRWRAWLLLAVACWAGVAPAFALTFTPGFSFCGPETRVWNFFPQSAETRQETEPQVADSHQGKAGYGYEIVSGVHVYLYANACPIVYGDPSGHYTQGFGYAVEKEVEVHYKKDFPGSIVSFGEVYGFKPDVLDHSRKRWMEVKPLSLSGVAKAELQWMLYTIFYGQLGYQADTQWAPGAVIVDGQPTFIFNFEGILFYTDSTRNLTELTAAAAIANMNNLAVLRDWLRRQSFPSRVSPEATARFGFNVARNASIASMTLLLATIPAAAYITSRVGI